MTVTDRGFLGTSTQFVVVTAWGQEMVVAQEPADLRPGDAGRLVWERRHMFVLDAVGSALRTVPVP